MNSAPIIVAIDGPSGVGKSTIGLAVAQRLGLPLLETGAMYRALAWQLRIEGLDASDRAAVERRAAAVELGLEERANSSVEILLHGEPLDSRVRSPEVSELTSVVSSYPGVRRCMVTLQREFANRRGAVVEGRDIGTRVFPHTPFKYFLTAPLEIRVERRIRQLRGSGSEDLSAREIETEVAQRDARDEGREESPLKLDESYTVIDTGQASVAEIADRIATAVRTKS